MTVKRRLLSIDGGGIRGIIAAEILVQMEDALKAHNSKWQRLSDYFDFISGTSTGSIIAAALAIGMPAREILKIYQDQGEAIFSPANYSDKDLDQLLQTFGLSGYWTLGSISNAIKWSGNKDRVCQMLLTKYNGENLEKALKDKNALGDITLGSSSLKTNLMIVTNNVTRGQTWFFVNNNVKGVPNKKSKHLDINADIPLWKIVRSSSAAPTFFSPFPFEDTSQKSIPKYEFIDGGVGSYNNSSFQLFLEAVHPNYGTGWDSGADNLLLVSIGAGFGYAKITPGKAVNKNNAEWAEYVVGSLMSEANLQQNQLIKLISKQKSKSNSNSLENGDSFKISNEELLTYCRFTVSFTVERFKQLIKKHGLELKDEKNKLIQSDEDIEKLIHKLEQMDCVDQKDNLSAVGKAVAKEQFDLSLFEGFLEDEVIYPQTEKGLSKIGA
ncbi:patatin-like phospholipase family protein [Nostoc sp. UIC 10890]